MQDYYNDNQIKFEYDPQINKFAFKKNHVGVTAGDEIALADYTYTDSNTIFVSNLTGNDTTGTGAQATPYKTILKGINSCTATKTKVVVLDYHIYAENISGYSNAYFSGLYSALPADREYSKYYDIPRLTTSADGRYTSICTLNNDKFVVGYSNFDDTNKGYFVIYDSISSISVAATKFTDNSAWQLKLVKLNNGNFVISYLTYFSIYDDTGNVVKAETNDGYLKPDCILLNNGNFVRSTIDSADGDKGKFTIYDSSGNESVPEVTFHNAATGEAYMCPLNNGNFVIVYSDTSGSTEGKFVIYDSSGNEIKSETEFEAGAVDLWYQCAALLSNDNFVIVYEDTTATDTKICIYDEDGISFLGSTQIDSHQGNHPCSIGLTDYFAVVYYDTVDNDENIIIFENDGTEYTAKQQIDNFSGGVPYHNLDVLSNGDILLSYHDDGDTDTSRWNIYTINELPKHSHRILGYTPTDSNSIFVSSEDTLLGDDTWAGTQKEPNLTIDGAVANVDGTHQAVVILDSETYTEAGQEMTGNFLGLYAAIGASPLYQIDGLSNNSYYTDAYEIKSPTEFEAGDTSTRKSAVLLNNGNWVCCYVDITDGNKVKFIIYDEDGTQVVAPTQFSANAGGSPSVALLNNTNWVCCYADATAGDGKFVIYDEDGTLVKSATEFEPGSTGYCSVALLNSNDWVCCYADSGTSDGKFVIYDEDGTQVVAPTQFESGVVAYNSVALLNNTNWVCCYRDATAGDGKFVIYDEDGINVAGPIQFETEDTDFNSIVLLNNTNWMCFYNAATSNKGRFVIYDEDGVNVAGPTQFSAANATYENAKVMQNGDIICAYMNVSGKYIVYDEDGNNKKAETEFEAGGIQYPWFVLLNNGNWVCCYTDVGDANKGKFVIWYPYSWFGLKVSAASTINGIEIDFQDDYLGTLGIWVNSAKPTIKWCNFENITNPTDSTIIGYGVYGDNETDLYNSIIADNDAGIYLGAAVNDAIIQDNQFYRNNVDYAIHIDGTAAVSGDITIEHNDIFDNYAGIRLENNNGTNEILKNNIIHNNDNDGINADSSQAYSYTIITDSTTNGSAGSSVILANPLYINEGAITPSAIDLNIKTQIEGYQTDSPAKDLADDSRNAGSLDVAYIGSLTTWTAITVSKPLQGSIDVEYEGSGVVKNQRRDGSISSNKISQTEMLTITWDGILNSEFDDIRAMWICTSSRVRIYMDPTTSPLIYDEYNLEYAKLKASPGNYILSETGVKGVKLIFGKSYTE